MTDTRRPPAPCFPKNRCMRCESPRLCRAFPTKAIYAAEFSPTGPKRFRVRTLRRSSQRFYLHILQEKNPPARFRSSKPPFGAPKTNHFRNYIRSGPFWGRTLGGIDEGERTSAVILDPESEAHDAHRNFLFFLPQSLLSES